MPIVCEIMSGVSLGLFALIATLPTTPAASDEAACDPDAPPTLRYFDARGRAEAIRLAMVDNSVDFVDATFTSDEWGKHSTEGLKAQWSASGKLAFGQVLRRCPRGRAAPANWQRPTRC
eukprot:SAG11_NODE_8817_length_973_cov_1.813501_3_plen_119_part_00